MPENEVNATIGTGRGKAGDPISVQNLNRINSAIQELEEIHSSFTIYYGEITLEDNADEATINKVITEKTQEILGNDTPINTMYNLILTTDGVEGKIARSFFVYAYVLENTTNEANNSKEGHIQYIEQAVFNNLEFTLNENGHLLYCQSNLKKEA